MLQFLGKAGTALFCSLIERTVLLRLCVNGSIDTAASLQSSKALDIIDCGASFVLFAICRIFKTVSVASTSAASVV